MNQEKLLQRLNSIPLNVNVKLMELKLNEYLENIWRASEWVKIELESIGLSVDEDFMETKNIVRYIKEYLIVKYRDARYANGEIQDNDLREEFPNDFLLGNFIDYKANISLRKRLESLLKHVKDGYIQPTFAINSANSIYTSKPAIQIPHSDLALYLDCDLHHFDSLEEAMNAISNAKADSEIITVIKKTVYFRTPKYYEEKERKRQEAIKVIDEL
ncbi:hypothetical protein J2S13_003139 [Oikeobacillus pervagus]|uniref:Uncharacterized protein n=1 Tax=Oikeobacillus pervagus TaxID=1325931 RepID=A0AAJ1T8P7_9BACI|nr:hypothetical protein [Oikeobacillus pervagus]MDQ0216665.1 hypothetical protein [Oikeobacillus pervagus]